MIVESINYLAPIPLTFLYLAPIPLTFLSPIPTLTFLYYLAPIPLTFLLAKAMLRSMAVITLKQLRAYPIEMY